MRKQLSMSSWVLLTAFAVLGAVHAACGGGEEESTIPSATATTPASVASTPQTPSATAGPTAETVATSVTDTTAVPSITATAVVTNPVGTPGPVIESGGTIQLAAREAFDHSDVHDDASPALSTWGPGLAYSRVFRFKSGPGVTLPSMAVECDLCAGWRMRDDLTFEFGLRDGVRWQDVSPVNGRALDASDVRFSYDRQREQDRPNASLLQSVESIEVLTPQSLRFTLKVADADFLSALADARSKIVAEEAVSLNGNLRGGPTVGTGPWVLKETRNDGSTLFDRNPDYFESPLPYADRLRIQVIPDPDARMAGFATGILDFHQSDPTEWIELLKQRPDAPVLRIPQPGTGLELAMNTTVPPFDDVSVRRAALFAMDPWQAIADIWKDAAFVSLGMPVAEESWLLTRRDLTPYFGQPATSRDLLASAGTPAPFTLKVGDYGPEYLAHAERVVEELQTVGFSPELEVVNQRTFGDEIWMGGDYEMFVGPIAPATMPNSYLLPILHSEGRLNTAGFRSADLDRLIETQASEYEAAERQRLLQEIQTLAFDSAFRFMPATHVSIWSWSSRVRDFYPNFAAYDYYHWSRVWLDEP